MSRQVTLTVDCNDCGYHFSETVSKSEFESAIESSSSVPEAVDSFCPEIPVTGAEVASMVELIANALSIVIAVHYLDSSNSADGSDNADVDCSNCGSQLSIIENNGGEVHIHND